MVNQSTNPRFGLTAQDMHILEHVRRYGMTTQEVVHRLFYPTATLEAAKSRLRRLREKGWLSTADLSARTPDLRAKRSYYHLTPQALERVFAHPAKYGKAQGPQALFEAYGILLFCCMAPVPRDRFMRSEFEQAYPDLVRPGLPARLYYRDIEDEKERVGYIYVHRSAHSRRVVRKCREVVAKRFRIPAWARRINDQGMVIAIVTSAPQSAKQIAEAIRREQWHQIRFRIEVWQDLLELM